MYKMNINYCSHFLNYKIYKMKSYFCLTYLVGLKISFFQLK